MQVLQLTEDTLKVLLKSCEYHLPFVISCKYIMSLLGNKDKAFLNLRHRKKLEEYLSYDIISLFDRSQQHIVFRLNLHLELLVRRVLSTYLHIEARNDYGFFCNKLRSHNTATTIRTNFFEIYSNVWVGRYIRISKIYDNIHFFKDFLQKFMKQNFIGYIYSYTSFETTGKNFNRLIVCQYCLAYHLCLTWTLTDYSPESDQNVLHLRLTVRHATPEHMNLFMKISHCQTEQENINWFPWNLEMTLLVNCTLWEMQIEDDFNLNS